MLDMGAEQELCIHTQQWELIMHTDGIYSVLKTVAVYDTDYFIGTHKEFVANSGGITSTGTLTLAVGQPLGTVYT